MNLSPVFKQRFFDQNGAPLTGGSLYSYVAGTATPQGTYADSAGTASTNPVVLDANGYADIWLDPTVAYKIVLKDANGVTQFTVDNVVVTTPGVATWNANQTFQQGAIALDTSGQGLLYVSLVNNNVNQALTNTSAWRMFGGNVRTVSTNTTLSVGDNLVRSNSTSGNLTHTLPAIASTPIGKEITVKDVGTGGHATTLQGSGTDKIDGSTIYAITIPLNSVLTVQANGSSWDVISHPKGPLGQQISGSSATFNGTSASYTAVTNLSVTITTTGRPVLICLQPDGSSNPAVIAVSGSASLASGTLGLYNGTAYIAQWSALLNPTSSTQMSLPGGICYLDTPAAGTITYSLYVKLGSGNAISVDNYKLVAYEL